MRKLLSLLLLALGAILPLHVMAQSPAGTTGNESITDKLLPRPASLVTHAGFFTGNPQTATVQMVSSEQLGTFDYAVEGFDNEGYKLSVTTTSITITAASDVGVIRARQTLEQLRREDGSIPCCDITDYPAFKVRGYMHDVGRSYISYAELKREVDLLSRFKVNMFHWHLTDHQGFRFESKKYPVLNSAGYTRAAGKFYTQAECRELDAYAHERGMMIIPEIDMPGHSTAFETATGHSMASAEGKAILKEILEEVVACFPHAPYIHIGGDETSLATAAYVKEMADYVHSLGKKAVCWNRYGSGALVTPSTMNVDMLTNWATRGTLVSGVPNIDMRYYYANHFDVFADLAGIFRSSIFGVEKGNKDVAGVSVGFWNDRHVADEKQIIAQNNLYASMLAIAERAWVGAAGHKYIEQGGAYLPNQGKEYDEFKDWEDRFLFYKEKWLSEEPIPYVRQANIIWNITKGYPNGGDKARTFAAETADTLRAETGSTFARGAGQWLNHIWNSTVTGVLGSQSNAQTRYAWTYVYSPREQEVGAQIEFYNYSRSDHGLTPQNGAWDNMGSRVWVNDEEILPTWSWDNAGVNVGRNDLEVDLGNLNFPGRTPVRVTLKEGWNKVLLKLPYVAVSGQARPNKWQYTFVFTTPDGKSAVDSLTYSPNRKLDGEDFTVVLPEPEPQYIIDKAHGDLTRNGTDVSTWCNTWTSADGLLTLRASANNMQWVGNNIDARSGQSRTSTYTLTAAKGYQIVSYSFDAKAISADNQTWTTGGNTIVVTNQATTTISGNDVGETSVDFLLTGANTGTLLTNFVVVLAKAPIIEEPESFTVFDNGGSTVPYRIPAIAKNQNGDLIFVADYRYSSADIGIVPNGKLDLRYRMKYADGTWSPVMDLAKCIETPTLTAFGDPCIVADRTSNRVMVTSCSGNVSFFNGTHDNHQGWARFYSEDGGTTWSSYTDISDQVFAQLDRRADGPIRCFFIGSGKISQSSRIKVGSHYRLYCAALVKVNDGTNVNYVFFSDDFGLNWHLLGDVNDCPVPTGGDEPKADELPDGSVVISSRSTGRIFNIFHFTNIERGEGKWGNAALSNQANNGCYGTTCNGEIMILPVKRLSDGAKTYLALQSIPAAGDRRNVSIYYKELTDLTAYRTTTGLASTWKKYQVSTTTSAYSTACLDADGDLAFFYEENSYNNGYDMVYKKIPVTTITKDKYAYEPLTDAERTAYLTAGVDPFFSTADYAAEEPVATLVQAYKAAPTDDNYCALNAVLNDIVLPSDNAKECPYASPAPTDGAFDPNSKAYTMQIKGGYYITTNSMTGDAFNTNNQTRPTTAEGYWVIAGSKNKGYRIYNVAQGATFVLGVTGAEAGARTGLYDIASVPEGVTTLFSYAPNTYNGSTTGASFFLFGTDNNALNVRAPYLALWNSANCFTDNGSRIELQLVDYDFTTVTGMQGVEVSDKPVVLYDLQGRRISQPQKGIYLQDGKKRIVR